MRLARLYTQETPDSLLFGELLIRSRTRTKRSLRKHDTAADLGCGVRREFPCREGMTNTLHVCSPWHRITSDIQRAHAK